jgi:hypothetical protein
MPHIHHERDLEARRPVGTSPVAWRWGRLVDAGFPRGLAARLARDTRYDLHALIELVERGCAPALAARILAPLDDEVEAA